MKIKDIDKYVAEGYMNAYSHINTRIKSISENVNKTCLTFNNQVDTIFLYEELTTLIFRKSKLIFLKGMIDKAVSKLEDGCRKVCLLKLRYPMIQISEICEVLDISERAVYRRLEKSYEDLSKILNKFNNKGKIIELINSESWLVSIIEDAVFRRKKYQKKGKDDEN